MQTTVLFIIEVILAVVSILLSNCLYLQFGFESNNSMLIGIIFFFVLTFIVALVFYFFVKNKVSMKYKKRTMITYAVLEVFNILLSLLLYFSTLYSKYGSFFNRPKILLLSIICFIVLNVFLFLINPITNKINEALYEKKYGLAVIIRGALNFFYCFLGYFYTVNFLEKGSNFIAVLLFIIIFLSSTLYFAFDFSKNKKNDNKIFISHSSKDEKYCTALFDLLIGIGVHDSQVFYSSRIENGVPLGYDIDDFLLEQFNDFDLHLILMFSKNYFTSIYCQHEMGAAWVKKKKSDIVLLPDFDYSDIPEGLGKKKDQIGIKLDLNEEDLKKILDQFKNKICNEFEIEEVKDWERIRDEFINKVKEIKVE